MAVRGNLSPLGCIPAQTPPAPACVSRTSRPHVAAAAAAAAGVAVAVAAAAAAADVQPR